MSVASRGRVSEPAATPDLLDTPDAGPAAIRGGAVRIVGYLAGVAVSVFASALLLRHLGVVAVGYYVTVLSLVTLAALVTEAGLAAIGVRELSTLPAELAGGFFRSLSGLRLVCVCVGVLFAVGFALLSGYSSTLVLGTAIAGAGVVLATTQTTYSLPLLARLQLGWVTAVEVLRQLGTTVVIIALVIAGAPLLPFWSATIPAGLAATVMGAYLVRRSMPLLPAFDREVWASLLRRTLPYSMAAAVGVVYFRLAILIMSHVSSGLQTGYFGASFRIIEILFVVPQLIVGSTLPIFSRAARDDRARLDYALGRTFDVCLLLGLAVGLSLVTGASFIIEVIAGPKFAPAVDVLRIQGIALISTFMEPCSATRCSASGATASCCSSTSPCSRSVGCSPPCSPRATAPLGPPVPPPPSRSSTPRCSPRRCCAPESVRRSPSERCRARCSPRCWARSRWRRPAYPTSSGPCSR